MRKLAFLSGIILVLALVVLSRRGNDDPEARIRAAINDGIEAAEAQDLSGVMEVVSERFKSRTMDRDQLKGMLFIQLRRGAWRRVFLTDAEITLGDEVPVTTAKVKLEALLASGKEVKTIEDVVPTNAAKYQFDLIFENEDDTWRVVSAEYKRVVF